MRYQIQLIAHNGNVGENSVEPFTGDTIDIDGPLIDKTLPQRDGRTFTYAFTDHLPEQTIYCFREKVETKPSDWALAREAERLAA